MVVPTPAPPKIRQPSTFAGASVGFAVDNWIGEMVQQFSYYGSQFPDGASRVRYAAAFLTDAAWRWWEQQDDRATLSDWDEFVNRLHARFRPVQAAMLARQRLGRLRMKEGHSVNQYVSVFQSTLTPIDDMGEVDQVFHFINGLTPGLAGKVWERHPSTLKQAIDVAVSVEAMGNFGRAAMVPRSFGSTYAGRSSQGPSSSSVPMDLNYIELVDSFLADTSLSVDASTSSAAVDPSSSARLEAIEQRLNALFQSRGPSEAPRHSKGPTDHVPGLSSGDITKMMSEGRCFRCRAKGHMKRECPKNKSKSKNE